MALSQRLAPVSAKAVYNGKLLRRPLSDSKLRGLVRTPAGKPDISAACCDCFGFGTGAAQARKKPLPTLKRPLVLLRVRVVRAGAFTTVISLALSLTVGTKICHVAMLLC